MKRIQTDTAVPNKFGAGKPGFSNGDPTVGLPATDLDESWFDQVQESLMRVQEAAGLVPADDYDQFLIALQKLIEARVGDYSLDTGVANAYVIALNPPITAYPATAIQVQFKVTNTSTVIAPTLNAGGGAITLVRGDGSALAPGDMVAGSMISATRDPATNKFYITSIVPSQAMSQAAADARYPRVASITSLPGANVGPIAVAEAGEIWIWSASAYYTGYRSPLCGRPVDGHTATPLASEFDAVGGLIPKLAYARVWGYAQENGLVVTQAVYDANLGAHYFVDVDATYFRSPNLSNMFRRYTGTDLDTANARTLGSYKADTLQGHWHTGKTGVLNSGGSGAFYEINNSYGVNGGAIGVTNPITNGIHGTPRTGMETAPKSAAFHPRIHA